MEDKIVQIYAYIKEIDNELNDLSQYANEYDMEVRYVPKRKNI